VAQAWRLRDELVSRGFQAGKRLAQLEKHVEQNVDRLVSQARARERVATWLLIALTLVTLLIGTAMAIYARRMLLPLGQVTELAKAVALGDLKPRPAVVSNDEIGELIRPMNWPWLRFWVRNIQAFRSHSRTSSVANTASMNARARRSLMRP
jgi:nitrate/nitrite-specific signal transduction histidine kinase